MTTVGWGFWDNNDLPICYKCHNNNYFSGMVLSCNKLGERKITKATKPSAGTDAAGMKK